MDQNEAPQFRAARASASDQRLDAHLRTALRQAREEAALWEYRYRNLEAAVLGAGHEPETNTSGDYCLICASVRSCRAVHRVPPPVLRGASWPDGPVAE